MDEIKTTAFANNKERLPDPMRYERTRLHYRRAGNSGLKLPEISLGLWQNFGSLNNFENMRDMIFTAFDAGITMFDLANNYGPRYGSAEENFGKILRDNLSSYRDEMLIATKAGYDMWEGPYGNGGSLKYLTASLDQSLKRMGLDYVDVFYHHRPDDETPIEETCFALWRAVASGKALYAGVSNYNAEQTARAVSVMKELKCPLIVNQVRYNLFDRTVEKNGLKAYSEENGIGLTAFSPLAQGLLTDKYKNGVPEESRMKRAFTLREHDLTPSLLNKTEALRGLASSRGQTLAEFALSWLLKDNCVSSVIIGASSSKQILENVTLNSAFTPEELEAIEKICNA